MKVAFKINNSEDVILNPIQNLNKGENIYDLINEDNEVWMEVSLINNSFKVNSKKSEIVESEIELQEKLDNLVLEVIEKEQSGTENTETVETSINPYNPDSIKVLTKHFNLTLIFDMIVAGYIDLSPDFQRNFVWDNVQKSRLIESILLRIPLPMFYFSEDEEGLITVVDGLQRLTTIKEFMDNKFPLRKLEYLKDSCEGRYYKDDVSNNLKGIDAKYLRWFNMTQFTVNVIDPTSPAKVKYDIFRRINTGGKPLNNQEIRNCLASKSLRKTLQEMVKLNEFKTATLNSIKSTRMEDQEVALRFIGFYLYYQEDKQLNNYNGNIEASLDDLVEQLSKYKEDTLKVYISLFSKAMLNSQYLLGRYAFRKILPQHLNSYGNKLLINKALFVSCSVLLSQYDPEIIKQKNPEKILASPLADSIGVYDEFYYYLSYGTNAKANLQFVFKEMENLIKKTLSF